MLDLTTSFGLKQASVTNSPLWTHLIAGGIAGAISRTCTAPADRIKIYLQVQTQKTGFTASIRHLIRDGGILSMWRGNGINVLKLTPESAIKFAVYDESKRFLRGDDPRTLTMGERFICGAIAGNVSQTLLFPMDVLKTRLALAKTGQYSGVMHMVKVMFEQEGLRSFYRGYSSFAVGIMFYCGIDLAIYETLKQAYLGYKEAENTMNPLVILSCCTLSSTIGQVVTYPLALLSSRLQAKSVFRKEVQNESFFDNNMLLLLWRIRQKEGISGWYRGILPNFMKSIPSVCITYLVYEYIINLLGYSMT